MNYMYHLVSELQLVYMCQWQAESVNLTEYLSIDFWINTFCSCLDLVRSMLKLEFADLFRFHNYMSTVFETIRTDRDPVSFFFTIILLAHTCDVTPRNSISRCEIVS